MLVVIATGSRSEYGVLEPLIKRINDDPNFELQLIVTGSHLSPEFGMTANQISFPYIPVETLLSSDSVDGTAKSVGVGIISLVGVLRDLKPDLLIVEGDRFEIFAAAQTAYMMRIPIAHISGGDITEGSLDDAYRDCITRMATLHFTDTEQAHTRVCQIRGRTNWVHCVGSLSLEGLENYTGLRSGALISLHPSNDIDANAIRNVMFTIIDNFKPVCYSAPNADAGGRALGQTMEQLAKSLDQCHMLNPGLGRPMFLDMLRGACMIIGNSSAGIVEAPFLGTPSINIGNRQKGRPRASSIIDCKPTEDSIQAAIKELNSQEFQDSLKDIQLAYEGGNVSEQIVEIIKEWEDLKIGDK